MKQAILLLCASVIYLNTSAQVDNINYDYEQNELNSSLPIPAENYFRINGSAEKRCEAVDISIYDDLSKNHPQLLYQNAWWRSKDDIGGSFSVPMRYKLHGNSDYDFRVTFYRNTNPTEIASLKSNLHSLLDEYVNASLDVNSKQIQLGNRVYQIRSDLNALVIQGMQNYESRLHEQFPGFSDLVVKKLQQLNGLRLHKGLFQFNADSANTAQQKAAYLNKMKDELDAILHNEVDQYLNTPLLIAFEQRTIKGVKTEKTSTILPLNFGYGAFYYAKDPNNNSLNYSSGAYAGISIPLANRAFNKFLGNTSISAGVFLQNFTNNNGDKITGPVIKRPIYGALGFKIFQFIRLNAGGVLIEQHHTTSAGTDKTLKVRPMVGISAEINIWAGFNSHK